MDKCYVVWVDERCWDEDEDWQIWSITKSLDSAKNSVPAENYFPDEWTKKCAAHWFAGRYCIVMHDLED